MARSGEGQGQRQRSSLDKQPTEEGRLREPNPTRRHRPQWSALAGPSPAGRHGTTTLVAGSAASEEQGASWAQLRKQVSSGT